MTVHGPRLRALHKPSYATRRRNAVPSRMPIRDRAASARLPELAEGVTAADEAALRPVLNALQIAQAAARAAQLRLGPETSPAAEAAIDGTQHALDALLAGIGRCVARAGATDLRH